MRLYLYLALGAILGAFARYQIGVWYSGGSPTIAFPWHTFAINVGGSLLLGVLMRYLFATPVSPEVRIMLTTGFCGAFTTFSSFSYETISLIGSGQIGPAVAYVMTSAVLAPAACFAGYALAGRLL